MGCKHEDGCGHEVCSHECPDFEEATPVAKGNACVVGDVVLYEEGDTDTVTNALVIQFPSVAAVKQAISDGKCTFTVLGGE